MTYLFAKTYARNAIEGHRWACKEIVVNYAHVYRKPQIDYIAKIIAEQRWLDHQAEKENENGSRD